MYVVFTVLSILFAVMVVEIVGYFWHRLVEHNALLGKAIRKYHIKHHDVDYTNINLRPANSYTSARSVGWYLLSLALVIIVYFSLPLPYNLIAIASGLIYAKLVLSYLHSKFHIKNHWLSNTYFYQRIQRLHDIHHWGPYNYGILFYFMDRLFGTYSNELPNRKQNNFPSKR